MIKTLELSVTASSGSETYPAPFGEIGFNDTFTWRAGTNNPGQYLEASFTSSMITGFSSMGESSYYVSEFKVEFYNDSSSNWV